jgi:TonB family protein
VRPIVENTTIQREARVVVQFEMSHYRSARPFDSAATEAVFFALARSRTMRSLPWTVTAGIWLILCPMATAKRDKKMEAAELFEKADQVVNFRSPGSPPFRVVQHLSIWTREKGALEGTYTLIWVDSDRWREELTLPDYHLLRVGGHQTTWRLQSRPLPTLAAIKARSISIMRIGKLSKPVQNQHVERAYEEQRGPSTAKCVSLSLGQWFHSTYCFDSKQGYVLNSKIRTMSNEQTMEWSDYLNLGGHWIPRLTREFLNGKPIAQSEIKDAILLPSVEPALFAPPAGAEQIEDCDDPEPPKPIRKPEPAYTSMARSNRVQGMVTLDVKIDRQGEVEDAAILESLDPGLDSEAVQTIKKKWKFQPASCGGTPIPTDVIVEINFRLF